MSVSGRRNVMRKKIIIVAVIGVIVFIYYGLFLYTPLDYRIDKAAEKKEYQPFMDKVKENMDAFGGIQDTVYTDPEYHIPLYDHKILTDDRKAEIDAYQDITRSSVYDEIQGETVQGYWYQAVKYEVKRCYYCYLEDYTAVNIAYYTDGTVVASRYVPLAYTEQTAYLRMSLKYNNKDESNESQYYDMVAEILDIHKEDDGMYYNTQKMVEHTNLKEDR